MESRYKFYLMIIGLAVVVFFGLVYAIWRIALTIDPPTVALWTAFATVGLIFGIPLLLGIGFYFGKVEARGFLHGADQVMEKTFGQLTEVVKVRDQSKINVRNEAPTPGPVGPVVLFPTGGYPQIQDRGINSPGGGSRQDQNDVIDID